MRRARTHFAAALALAAGGLVALSAAPAHAENTDGGAFNPVAPARILDTRPDPYNVGAPPAKVAGQTSVTFDVAGEGGVPASNVSAVVLNVAVTAATKPGFVTAFPANLPTPPTASNLNFAAGQTLSNHVTVKLGADGKVKLFNGSSEAIHLIADVNGWYADGPVSAAGMFTALAPRRVLDTRPPPNNVGHLGKVGGQQTINVQVAGVAPIPASTVGAGVFNLAVTAPTKAGFITGYPTGATMPTAANLNYVANQTLSNAATIKLGASGRVSLFNGQPSGSNAHYIADANGWFQSGTAISPGAFTPVDPTRIRDTRPAPNTVGPVGKVPAGGSITVDVGTAGVPTDQAGAAAFNLAVTGNPAPGHVTAYPADGCVPTAANLNFAANETVSNLVTVKLDSGKARLFNGSSQPVDLVADLAGWYKAGVPTPLLPAQILDLTNWKLTLPVPKDDGSGAKEIKQPTLATFEVDPWFEDVDGTTGGGVRFRADTCGATTSENTNFPRSELREMNGTTNAAWRNDRTGTHTMTIEQAITHFPLRPNATPAVVAGQIHDGDRDIIVLRAEKKADGVHLYAKAGTTTVGELDEDYQLGARFRLEMEATHGSITVRYWKNPAQEEPTRSFTRGEEGDGWYFKAGAYTQASSRLDPDDNQYGTGYGEVIIYDLAVTHSG